MSTPAQVTEAHRELARRIMFEFTAAGTATASDVRMAAQLIADSEAKACDQASAQVESLLSAAKNAIPASEHPAEPTVQNWAWQIRNLGDDRRLVYAERDQLRAEVKESGARARVAIASWDEERQRALRESGRVIELRAERASNHDCINRIASATGTLGEKSEKVVDVALSTIAALRAEVERLKTDGAASAFVTMSCRASRAETDRNNLRADLDAIKAILTEEKARAERAEADADSTRERALTLANSLDEAQAELAAERARLDYMSNCGFEHLHNETGDHLGHEWTISSYGGSHDVTLRDVIDAEMKEEAK